MSKFTILFRCDYFDVYIEFYKSGNSSSTRALHRSRSAEKFTPSHPPLAQIHENQAYGSNNKNMFLQNNFHSFNMNQQLQQNMPTQSPQPHSQQQQQTQFDSMGIEWQVPQLQKSTAHFQFSSSSKENQENVTSNYDLLSGKRSAQPSPIQSFPKMIPGISENLQIFNSTPMSQLSTTNDVKRPLLEKMSVPPLSTERLLPTRYKTKNAVMSILRSGEVVLEFIKYKGRMKEERVTDVCWISNDGMRILIFQPDPGR